MLVLGAWGSVVGGVGWSAECACPPLCSIDEKLPQRAKSHMPDYGPDVNLTGLRPFRRPPKRKRRRQGVLAFSRTQEQQRNQRIRDAIEERPCVKCGTVFGDVTHLTTAQIDHFLKRGTARVKCQECAKGNNNDMPQTGTKRKLMDLLQQRPCSNCKQFFTDTGHLSEKQIELFLGNRCRVQCTTCVERSNKRRRLLDAIKDRPCGGCQTVFVNTDHLSDEEIDMFLSKRCRVQCPSCVQNRVQQQEKEKRIREAIQTRPCSACGKVFVDFDHLSSAQINHFLKGTARVKCQRCAGEKKTGNSHSKSR